MARDIRVFQNEQGKRWMAFAYDERIEAMKKFWRSVPEVSLFDSEQTVVNHFPRGSLKMLAALRDLPEFSDVVYPALRGHLVLVNADGAFEDRGSASALRRRHRFHGTRCFRRSAECLPLRVSGWWVIPDSEYADSAGSAGGTPGQPAIMAVNRARDTGVSK